jgi:catechol-2,3-dioxygenase
VAITRLNHAVLYVRDVAVSEAFYRDLLGFGTVMAIPGQAVFLRAEASTNDHDLGLFQMGPGAGPSGAGRSTVGLYHLAWEVRTLGELLEVRERLSAARSLVGQSDHVTTKSIYALDPDGLEFEISWLLPADLITDEVKARGMGTFPLDLEAEVARYGADTRGGLGVSIPLGSA